MNLTLKLDPTNWLEATWFEQTSAPDTVIPAKEAVLDEEGNEVSPAEPERVEQGQVTKTQVKCVSYHPTQIDMLRDAFGSYTVPFYVCVALQIAAAAIVLVRSRAGPAL